MERFCKFQLLRSCFAWGARMHSQTALNSVYFKSSKGGEPVESPGASTRKIKAIQKQVEVHIYQHGTQELTDVDELGYEHYTLHNADETSPLKWYECSPVMPNRIAMMHLQPESGTCVSVLWSGARNCVMQLQFARALVTTKRRTWHHVELPQLPQVGQGWHP